MRKLITLGVMSAMLTGCGTGYRSCSQAALVSVRSPVFVANGTTNSSPACAQSGSARAEQSAALTLPVNSRAPMQIYAEQVLVMFYGGSASSNEVLSHVSIPLTQ